MGIIEFVSLPWKRDLSGSPGMGLLMNGRESGILRNGNGSEGSSVLCLPLDGRREENQIHDQGRILQKRKWLEDSVSYSYPCGSTVLVMVIESRVGIGNMNIGYGMDLLVLMLIWVAPGLIPWVGSIG